MLYSFMGTDHSLTYDAVLPQPVMIIDQWCLQKTNVTFNTHLRLSKISWCFSWEVLPWMAHTAWRSTSVCLEIISYIGKLYWWYYFWYWEIIRIIWWNYPTIILMKQLPLTIIGDELVDPFSTGCSNLPAKELIRDCFEIDLYKFRV